MSNFDLCFKLVVGHEGGFTDDRRDRGNWTSGKIGVGELKGTKYGVSAMSYPHTDIKNLTLEDAKDIYRRDFWNKNRCDQLPDGIAYLVFDAAINHGSSRAGKFLQAAIGGLTVDGIIGEKTVAAAQRGNHDDIVSEFCVVRGLFYTDIGTFQTYKKGWFRRLFDTHATALALDDPKETPEDHICAVTDESQDDLERAFWLDLHRSLQEAAQRASKIAG